jgi:hypothetical protein
MRLASAVLSSFKLYVGAAAESSTARNFFED